MIIEYTGCQISAVRLLNQNENQGLTWVTGSRDEEKNRISLWTSSHTPHGGDDRLSLKLERYFPFSGDVNGICCFKDTLVAIASSPGFLHLFDTRNFDIQQVFASKISSMACNDVIYMESLRCLVASGDEGTIVQHPLEASKGRSKVHRVSETPISSLDSVSNTEVICGNSAGHLKVVDCRKGDVVMSLPNTLSQITVVRRNPSNGHLVASGNDMGNVCLFDLRNTGSVLIQFSAHDSLLTELQYKQSENNVILSSSLDGQLLKWNLQSGGQLTSVYSVVQPQSLAGPSINCFHLNPTGDEVMFASDNEVLSLTTI